MDSDYYAEESRQLFQSSEPKDKKQMQIQIIATSVETKPTAKGSYQQLEVTFKNLTYQGKVEAKKIMSFGANAGAFTALKDAPAGTTFNVTVVKNDKGYNDWTTVVPAVDGEAAPAAAGKPSTSPRSTYETPEERAQRQVLIVRQSSLSAAVATLAVGSKGLKPEEVIAVAKEYENYVFDIKDPGASGFEDVPDFDVE